MYTYAQHDSYHLKCNNPSCQTSISSRGIERYKNERNIDVHNGGPCPRCGRGTMVQVGKMPSVGGGASNYDSPNWPKDENGNPLPPYTFEVRSNKRKPGMQSIMGRATAVDENGNLIVKRVPIGTRHFINDSSDIKILRRRESTIGHGDVRENYSGAGELNDIGVSGLTVPPPLKINELSSEKDTYLGIDGGFARIFGMYTPVITNAMTYDAYRKKYDRVCYRYMGIIPHQDKSGKLALDDDMRTRYEASLRVAADNMKRKLDLGEPVIMDGIKFAGPTMVDEWYQKMISNPGEIYDNVQLAHIRGPFQVAGWKYEDKGIGINGESVGQRAPIGFEKINTTLLNQRFTVKGTNDVQYVPIPKNLDIVLRNLNSLIQMTVDPENEASTHFQDVINNLNKYIDFDETTPVDSSLLRTNLNMVKLNDISDDSPEARYLTMIDSIERGYSPAVDKIKKILVDNNVIVNTGADSDVDMNDYVLPVNFLRGVNGLQYPGQNLGGAYYYPSDIELQIKNNMTQNRKEIDKYEDKERETQRLTEYNPDAASNPANLGSRPKVWNYQLDISMVPRTPKEVEAAIKAKYLRDVSNAMRNKQSYDDFVKSWIVYSGGMSAAEAQDAGSEVLADSVYDPGPALKRAQAKAIELNQIYQKSVERDKGFLRDLQLLNHEGNPKRQQAEMEADLIRIPKNMPDVVSYIHRINNGDPDSDRLATMLQKSFATNNLVSYKEYKQMNGDDRSDFDTFTRLLWEWSTPPKFVAQYLEQTKEVVATHNPDASSKNMGVYNDIVSTYGKKMIPVDMDKYNQLLKLEKETGVNVRDQLNKIGVTTIQNYIGDYDSEGFIDRINKVIGFISSYEQNSVMTPGEATTKIPVDDVAFNDINMLLDALRLDFGQFYQKYYANTSDSTKSGANEEYKRLRQKALSSGVTQDQLYQQLRSVGYETNTQSNNKDKRTNLDTDKFDVNDLTNVLGI